MKQSMFEDLHCLTVTRM